MVIYARSWSGKKEPGSRVTAWDPVVAELPDLTDMTSQAYVNEVDTSKVQQFGLQRNQAGLALRAYDVAKKRLDMTRKRYRIGKILVTDGLFPYIRNETK